MRVEGARVGRRKRVSGFPAGHFQAVGRAGEFHTLIADDGTFLRVTPRPPNRLAEPGRICMAVRRRPTLSKSRDLVAIRCVPPIPLR